MMLKHASKGDHQKILKGKDALNHIINESFEVAEYIAQKGEVGLSIFLTSKYGAKATQAFLAANGVESAGNIAVALAENEEDTKSFQGNKILLGAFTQDEISETEAQIKDYLR
jgi:hypothetical protein